MPHKRTVKKGSFAGHLDELVKAFEPEPPSGPDKTKRKKKLRPDGMSVHDRLFVRAWKADDGKPPL